MKPNRKLFVEVLAHIHVDEKRWTQGVWVAYNPYLESQTGCGTTACFAGWATLLSGAELDMDTKNSDMFPDDSRNVTWQGELVVVQDLAERLLGITQDVADELFQGINSKLDLMYKSAAILGINIDDLRWLVKERAVDIRKAQRKRQLELERSFRAAAKRELVNA